MTTHGTDAARGDRDAIERLLGPAELRWLVQRVRARLAAGAAEPRAPLAGIVQVRDPSPAQRAAAVRLVGPSRRTSSTLRVDFGEVESVLRRGPWPAGLADAVVTLTGPVADRVAERARLAEGWARAEAALAPAIDRHPGLGAWWERWCADGSLKRLTGRDTATTEDYERALAIVQAAAGVLAELPTAGEPLAVFARRTVGDAHGLDQGRRLSRIVIAAVRGGLIPPPPESGTATPAEELSVRDAWARVGVVMSAVSSTVLCLGVPGAAPGTGRAPLARATAQVLDALRAARAPVVLTLDQVRSGGVLVLPPETRVYVCENPTVVEVAAARWTDAQAHRDLADAVLVCANGQPSTAVVELLGTLTSAGAVVHYHGDFDWAGLRIADRLRVRLPWEPWRFAAADYVDAADLDAGARSRALAGAEAGSPWDPALATAMRERGLAIEEEAVADLLAADLLAADLLGR